MELKHYTKEDDKYFLVEQGTKKNRKSAFFLLVVMMLVVLRPYLVNGHFNTDSLVVFGFIGLLLMIWFFNASREVCIEPEKQIVIVNQRNKQTQYNFDQLLNFQKTPRRVYGLVTVSWSAKMYFRVKGENIFVILTMREENEEVVDEIISETAALLNCDESRIWI